MPEDLPTDGTHVNGTELWDAPSLENTADGDHGGGGGSNAEEWKKQAFRSRRRRTPEKKPATTTTLEPSLPRPTLPVILTETERLEDEKKFMDWCKYVLGIETLLEIQTFEYYDYMKALPDEDWNDGEELDDNRRTAVEDLPKIPVRGLAASRDIEEGETVIRIPLQALLSVATTIDQDPILGRVMGPTARRKHGWETTIEDDARGGSADNNAGMGGAAGADDDNITPTYLYEMPLLAVSLLHHCKLGKASPLAPYLRILQTSPTDSMPFLWSPERLRSEASEGIRTVARGIQREIKEMYQVVVQVLIRENPELFGPPPPREDGEWLFSYEKFQWAFAIVNSRHWQLPIEDLEARPASARSKPKSKHRRSKPTRHLQQVDEQGVPPADMPTDSWVQEHEHGDGEIEEEDDDEEEEEEDVEDDDNVEEDGEEEYQAENHSFLAPVADLLNFGPPCTRGRYNEESRTFDILATCAFAKGDEVTFWYSDECDHIMVGVYGFTHPMVPPCPSAEEYRARSEEYMQRSQMLEQQLQAALEDLDYLQTELEHVRGILEECDCCQQPAGGLRRDPALDESASAQQQQQQRREDIERHGVRRVWRDRDRRSEF